MELYYAGIFEVIVNSTEAPGAEQSCNMLISFDVLDHEEAKEAYTREAAACVGADWEESEFDFNLKRALTVEQYEELHNGPIE